MDMLSGGFCRVVLRMRLRPVPYRKKEMSERSYELAMKIRNIASNHDAAERVTVNLR